MCVNPEKLKSRTEVKRKGTGGSKRMTGSNLLPKQRLTVSRAQWFIAGVQPQRGLVTLLPQSARRAAKLT